MAKKAKSYEAHIRIAKRTSIGNPNKTKLKTSSMNKHKRLNKGL
jgi:hypothetical protein|tara:strand:+ start:1218 stop:1349 length:132 start_codon:yes stop_codon:yes gene_type:complete